MGNLLLAPTVRAMKVYGITDDNLDHIEENQSSASEHWGYFTFVLGVLANVFTNWIFQEKMTPIAWTLAGITTVFCAGIGYFAYTTAKRGDRKRKSLIQNIKDNSISLDPGNEQVAKLLEQIKNTTSGTLGNSR